MDSQDSKSRRIFQHLCFRMFSRSTSLAFLCTAANSEICNLFQKTCVLTDARRLSALSGGHARPGAARGCRGAQQPPKCWPDRSASLKRHYRALGMWFTISLFASFLAAVGNEKNAFSSEKCIFFRNLRFLLALTFSKFCKLWECFRIEILRN